MRIMKFGGALHEIDDLANKVLTGEKTATSSLYDLYLCGQKEMSRIGDLFVVHNSADEEIALVRIEKIEKIKFGDITVNFALEEGDGSLENWLTIHQPFYSGLLAAIGLELNRDTLLVCEWFNVVDPIEHDTWR